MKGMAAVLLLVLLANPVTSTAVARDKAAYVGGTLARFNRTGTAIEGRVEISPRHFVFFPENGPHAAEPLRIDYESIRHLEFGQRTSRRVPLAVGAAVLLGPPGLLSLAAKSRAHYLTMTYAGEQGRSEVIVIELGKSMVRPTLGAVEARSRIPIEYQDEEARKWRQ
jgi:hypothetical protein